jgi:succinyl-CoA synthetase beta subunit
MLSDNHIEAVSEFGYPMPSLTVVDKAAAELRGRLIAGGYPVLKSKGLVEEGIKEVRGWITPDENNVTRLLVHPRCRHLRQEMVSYVYDDNDKVVKAYDHGPDALRYLLDRLKYNR